MKLISLLGTTFVFTIISIFIPFATPLIVIIPGAILLQNTVLYVLISAVVVSFAYSVSIFIIHRINKRIIKIFPSLDKKMHNKATIKIDYIFDQTGYKIITPLVATVFPGIITLVLGFKKKVNYFKFFFYSLLGQILSIGLFVSGFTSIIDRDISEITGVILLIYAFLIAYTVWYIIVEVDYKEFNKKEHNE